MMTCQNHSLEFVSSIERGECLSTIKEEWKRVELGRMIFKML